MTEWTWKTWDEIRRADQRRTAAFNVACNALATQPHLGAAISAYNQIMMAATTAWKDECADAIALSEDEPF
jgi:hypothetical protein